MKGRILYFAMALALVLYGCQHKPETVSVTGVTLDCSSMTLPVGDSKTITATVSPSNADNKIILWTVDDSSVASASGGKVLAE